MDKQVTIICRTCEGINKNWAGTPDYVVLETEYESLTDAIEHLLGTEHSSGYQHRMEAVVKE